MFFDVEQNKSFFIAFSYQILGHLMTLKIKDNKLFGRNCILVNFMYREYYRITGIFLWIEDPDPDPVFSRILNRITQKDRIRIRNTG